MYRGKRCSVLLTSWREAVSELREYFVHLPKQCTWMTRDTGGQRFLVSECLGLSTWLILWNFSWVAWVLVRGRSSEHGYCLSQTLALAHCGGEQWRKEALPDGFRVGLWPRRSQFYLCHFHLKPWFSKACQDLLNWGLTAKSMSGRRPGQGACCP